MGKKRDFLSNLEDALDQFKANETSDIDEENSDIDENSRADSRGASLKKKVTFGSSIHQRAFDKNKSVIEFEEDMEDPMLNEEDDSDNSEDSEELDFESLSPAEQLRILMEPTADDDDDDEDEDEEEDDDEYSDEYKDGKENQDDDFAGNGEMDYDEEDEEEDGEEEEDSSLDSQDDEFPSSRSTKKLRLSLDEEGEDDDEEEEEEEVQIKSTFEKQQERLGKTIRAFEEENVSGKAWMLRGEVTAKQRPLNSLLEQDLDFEHASRAAPVITEQITESIETTIRQRIKDQAWDDVERKTTAENANKKGFDNKKLVELDSEKSKKSLAEVYEDEYSKSKTTTTTDFPVDEEANKAHDGIVKLFAKICRKIDSLSGFKFAPRSYPLAELDLKPNKDRNATVNSSINRTTTIKSSK